MAKKRMVFRPSARLQRYLGRELISDPNLAIIEFVKNSYDAGASHVFVEFRLREEPNRLIICDDGTGMDEAAFRANWLRPGFSEKSPDFAGQLSSAVANEAAARLMAERVPSGEKGLGRLAAGRLGDVMEVWTRPTSQAPWMHVVFDWRKFDDMTLSIDDVNIPYDFRVTPPVDYVDSGTVVQISGLRQSWIAGIPGRPVRGRRRTRLGRLKQDLQYLVRPLQPERRQFEIELISDSWTRPDDVGLISAGGERSGAEYAYRFDIALNKSGVVVITREITRSPEVAQETGLREHQKLGKVVVTSQVARDEGRPEELRCGPFAGTFLYTPPPAARRAREVDAFGAGVLLYRSGILVEPYGLPGDDWVGVEARKASRQGHAAIQPATFSGHVEISRLSNPELEDMSNRLGLLENEASEDFFSHVRAEFRVFESLIYNEIVRPRWQTPASKATAQARRDVALASIRVRAIAHSAGQPLQSLGFEVVRLENLSDRSDLPADVRDSLSDIHQRMAMHLAKLGRIITRFADEKPLEFEEVSVASIIDGAVEDAASSADAEGVELRLSVKVPRARVLVPADMVVDALSQLLINAIEAERSSDREPWVEISAEDGGQEKIHVRVSDNGTGIIDKEAGDDILSIPSTKARPAEGLPLVDSTIRLAAGSVRIEDTNSAGTTIVVELTRVRHR